MKLIGMLDSPFVRRVAISMALLEMPYEHCDWSVGRDLARIREFSPLGRVPALVLDDGDVLTESGAILDYLDDCVGPARALLPPQGLSRRQALQIMARCIGAAEKARDQVYERAMRPAEKRSQPWVERLNSQMHGALGELEVASGRDSPWLVGERMTQADITLGCVFTFIRDTVLAQQASDYPALVARVAALEALPPFKATYTAFFVPRG
jgi:glutathione S-transferase